MFSIKLRFKGLNCIQNSPICVNVTPLQVELLEKDLQDIKASLQEAKTHNQYLSSIIEQQKKSVYVLLKRLCALYNNKLTFYFSAEGWIQPKTRKIKSR